MTIVSDLKDSINNGKQQFQKSWKLLNQIIDILKEFKNNYDKKFNFSRLMRYMKIPNSEMDDLIEVLLNFQEIFEDVFMEYRLKKKRANNQVYLITEKKEILFSQYYEIPSIIPISSSHLKVFNDIIYTFKFIKRGSGFNLTQNGTELLNNVKQIKLRHPYLFESKNHGLIYPSSIGLKLGELIISYNKSNKTIKKLTIDKHIFEVKKDG
jgi:predicted transcriptional regulator